MARTLLTSSLVPQVSSSLAVPVCEGLQASLGHVASSSALVAQYTTQAQALPQPTNLTPQKRPYAQPDHLAYVAHTLTLLAPTHPQPRCTFSLLP